MIKINIVANNGKEKGEYMYIAEEQGNNSPYGSGQYISLKPEIGQVILVDCRYMKGYSLEKAARNYLSDYFGDNLKEMTVTIVGEGDK